MEIKWLEDFLSLASTGNFSRSADMRNVTQPAFSRRIKSLEMWAGVDLIDRSTYPTTLTKEGIAFKETAEETLRLLYTARDTFSETRKHSQLSLSFCALHTLATSFFPSWLATTEEENQKVTTRVKGMDLHDCVEILRNGDCDFMLCYAHESSPMLLDPTEYPSIRVGHERFLPVSAPREDGTPKFTLPMGEEEKVPFLSYTENCFLGKLMLNLLTRDENLKKLDTVYENSMASALKGMAINGFGFTWIPENLIKQDLQYENLVIAADEAWTPEIEIRLYRSQQRKRPIVEEFWKWVSN
ncbi:LysR substrate-binding domain-containing protein [Terasakiella sp. A23]|uniref:LysR substrate-binding domain-containing protein n=1 Tax=Terasakiella sp. FCG-A23 TaxID=3080561 RepID=UPI002955A4DD|nr:LysR substrate-binding domain-containing protein [Terasakiella sp. A23]MDV7341212.1 LysR substrate-binding domain-containing protein [Terasakiella sp. A23]